MATEFARIHAYKAGDALGVLAEADRQEGAHPHVKKPIPPTWIQGSAAKVQAQLDAHMASPEKLRMKGGKIVDRKRRKDSRALTAGVISWPDTVAEVKADPVKMAAADAWLEASFNWLRAKYGNGLAGVVVHMDESHPHLHFFIVGDCQRVHPGLAAQHVNGKRMSLKRDCGEAIKAGLRDWLDEYHERVGQFCGLERGEKLAKPVWRIADRGIRSKIIEIDRVLERIQDEELADLRDNLYDASPKAARKPLRF